MRLSGERVQHGSSRTTFPNKITGHDVAGGWIRQQHKSGRRGQYGCRRNGGRDLRNDSALKAWESLHKFSSGLVLRRPSPNLRGMPYERWSLKRNAAIERKRLMTCSRLCATLLAAIVFSTSGLRAEDYIRFRGAVVEKNGKSPTQLYAEARKTIVDKFTRDLGAREGTTVSLEQFSQRNWPLLQSEFERSRGKLELRLAMLQDYTSRSATGQIAPGEYYDEIVAQRAGFPGFSSKEQWLVFQKNTPVQALGSLRKFPTTAEAGLASYGKHVQLQNILHDWTLEQLEKRQSGLAKVVDPAVPLASLHNTPGRILPDDVRQEHARRIGLLADAAARLILQEVSNEIQFGSPADRESFKKLMEQELSVPVSPELPAELFKQQPQ